MQPDNSAATEFQAHSADSWLEQRHACEEIAYARPDVNGSSRRHAQCARADIPNKRSMAMLVRRIFMMTELS